MTKAKVIAELLRARPKLLYEVVVALNLPLPTCEGFQGPCGRPVIHGTASRTMYEWDGVGEDPNRDLLLCPECSAAYAEMMQDQWDEYYAGVLG